MILFSMQILLIGAELFADSSPSFFCLPVHFDITETRPTRQSKQDAGTLQQLPHSEKLPNPPHLGPVFLPRVVPQTSCGKDASQWCPVPSTPSVLKFSWGSRRRQPCCSWIFRHFLAADDLSCQVSFAMAK